MFPPCCALERRSNRSRPIRPEAELMTETIAEASAHQFCTFYLDHLLFGIESQKIQEVVTYRELRPVPLAPPVVSGLMNLRGQVVVALELRRQLELPERPSNMTPVCLVVHSAGGTVCLLADEVGNVVEVEDETFEPSPETLSPRLRSVILG